MCDIYLVINEGLLHIDFYGGVIVHEDIMFISPGGVNALF